MNDFLQFFSFWSNKESYRFQEPLSFQHKRKTKKSAFMAVKFHLALICAFLLWNRSAVQKSQPNKTGESCHDQRPISFLSSVWNCRYLENGMVCVSVEWSTVLLLDVPDLFEEGRKLFVLDLEGETELRVHVAERTQLDKGWKQPSKIVLAWRPVCGNICPECLNVKLLDFFHFFWLL